MATPRKPGTFVRATDDEKRAYAATKPIYPLGGFVAIEGGVVCAVEALGGVWSKEDPQWEIMAPTGHHFEWDGTHSLLCINLADVRARASGATLVACSEECE